jgi:hypothetical protein
VRAETIGAIAGQWMRCRTISFAEGLLFRKSRYGYQTVRIPIYPTLIDQETA